MAAHRLVGPLLALAVAATACTGKPVSLSAQAGSTIVVPLGVGAKGQGTLSLVHVGYAGTKFSDPQRGGLYLELEQTGERLDTRMAFLTEPVSDSGLAGFKTTVGRTLMLVVDIPDTVSHGVFDLELWHERTDPETGQTHTNKALGIDYYGTLAILPPSIDVDVTGQGDIETIEGAQTPHLYATGRTGVPYDNYAFQPENAVPLPSFGIEVREAGDPARPPTDPWVSYAKIEVTYPSDQIDVVDVLLSEPLRGQVWYRDEPVKNLLTIEAIAFSPVEPSDTVPQLGTAGLQMSPLRVVFDLDDATQWVLDLSEVDADLKEATDETGADLMVARPLSAIETAIR